MDDEEADVTDEKYQQHNSPRSRRKLSSAKKVAKTLDRDFVANLEVASSRLVSRSRAVVGTPAFHAALTGTLTRYVENHRQLMVAC